MIWALTSFVGVSKLSAIALPLGLLVLLAVMFAISGVRAFHSVLALQAEKSIFDFVNCSDDIATGKYIKRITNADKRFSRIASGVTYVIFAVILVLCVFLVL